MSGVLFSSVETDHLDEKFSKSSIWTEISLVANNGSYMKQSPLKKCTYPAFFWSVFFQIRTVRMRENKDQNNTEYGRFSRSE